MGSTAMSLSHNTLSYPAIAGKYTGFPLPASGRVARNAVCVGIVVPISTQNDARISRKQRFCLAAHRQIASADDGQTWKIGKKQKKSGLFGYALNVYGFKKELNVPCRSQ
jgi:hypothetical protein